MAKQKQPETAPAPEVKEVVYSQEEMVYREDLMKKIMTLEHVKGILIAREDAPIFINQIDSLKDIVIGWYTDAINKKAGGVMPEPAGGEPEDDDGSGDDGSTAD